MLYSDPLLSTAAQCLPPTMPYEYQSRSINCIPSSENARPIICERPAYFGDVLQPVYHKSNEDQLLPNINSIVSSIVQQPVAREVQCPASSLMPIYQSDPDARRITEFLNLSRNTHHFRPNEAQNFNQQIITRDQQQIITPNPSAFDGKQTILVKELPISNQNRPEHIPYYPNRISNEIPNSNLLTDRSNHDKYWGSIVSSGNYPMYAIDEPLAKTTVDSQAQAQAPTSAPAPAPAQPLSLSQLQSQSQSQSQPQPQLNQSSQFSATNQPYPSIERANYTRMHNAEQDSQFRFTNEPNTSKPPIIASSSMTNFDFKSPQMNEAVSSFVSHDHPHINKPVQSSIYDNNPRGMHADEIKQREVNRTVIESNELNEYENGSNDRSTEQFKKDVINDVYMYEKEIEHPKILPRVESTEPAIKAASTATFSTNGSTLTPSTLFPSKSMHNNFSMKEDIKHVPHSAITTTYNETPNESHYRYENASETHKPMYHQEDTNILTPTNNKQAMDAVNRIPFPTERAENDKSTRFGEKRRSSFDSGSLAKTLDNDDGLDRKSIAANIRRRYSVAANFLNLKSTSPDQQTFNFSPTPVTEYSRDLSNLRKESIQLASSINRIPFESDNLDTKSGDLNAHSNQNENKVNSFDSEVVARDGNNVSETVSGYSSQRIATTNAQMSQLPLEAVHGDNFEQNATNITHYDDNMPYSAYATDDQTYVENAMEQLHLGNDDEQTAHHVDDPQFKQEEIDKIRNSGTHR